MTDADPILAAIATQRPIRELISHVLSMREPEAGSAGTERIRAVVNAGLLTETAARHRVPAEVAGLGDALRSAGEEDLAAHVLEVAAASRTAADLASIAACLDGRDHAAALLRAVVRRRLPADIAAVLCRIADARQAGLIEELLGCLNGGRDAVWVMLELRGQEQDELSGRAARAMAARLPPARLAELALGLRRHQDADGAGVLLDAALGQEVGQAAQVIAHLFGTDAGYAYEALDQAVRRLAPADHLVLASLLEEGVAAETAADIWARIIPGLDTFAEAFESFAQYAGPSAVQRALEEAARAHSTDRIAALVHQVNARRIEDGVNIIFAAFVEQRPVEDIRQLANQFRDASWSGLAADLLDLAIERVPERDGVEDAATLIGLLLERAEETEWRGRAARADLRRWRQGIPDIITKVAQRRDPGHLMGLVDGLVKSGRYGAYRDSLEKAVTASFTPADLARLPQVRGYEHLPVVVELMCAPLQNPSRVPPSKVPQLIAALRAAGATDEYLQELLIYVGYRRELDFREIIVALVKAGMVSDGETLRTGNVWRVKGKRVRPPRFFSG